MNIKTIFSNIFSTKATEENMIAGASLNQSSSDITALISNAQEDNYKDWVFRAVKTRADKISEIEFYAVKKGGEKITSHPVLDFLWEVDWEAVSSIWDLTGNAYIYISRYSDGTPAHPYIIHPSMVEIVLNKENKLEIAYYKIGKSLQVPPEDIIHFKSFNPKQKFPYHAVGQSIISSIASSVVSDKSARSWNINFFKNSARPDGFLTTDQKLNATEIKQVRENFIAKYGGLDNAHKLGLLSGGLKFEQISLSQKDIDFIEQSRMSMDEILASFGVPKSEVGLVSDYNRANAEASNYVFMKNTINPQMKKIATLCAKSLVKDYKDIDDIEHVSVVPEDQTTQLAIWTAGCDRWMTKNEIREMQGLPPVKDGDILYNSLALVPIDSTPVKAKKIEETKPDFKGLASKLSNVVKEMEKTEVKKKAQAETQRIDLYVKGWKNIFKSQETKLAKDVKKYFDEQEKAIMKILDKNTKSFGDKKGIVLDGFVKDINKEFEKQMSLGISFITPRIMDYILNGANNASDNIGADNLVKEDNKDVIAWTKQRATFFASSINDTTKESILEAVRNGVSEDLTSDEIVSKIKDVFVGASDYRATMIARTEISAGANFGAVQEYKLAGFTKHVWKVVNPDDEDCLMNEGAVADIGDDFPSGDSEAPIHPNCQCTTIAVLE